MGKKAVCLISGGMDSAVASAIAKKEGYEIHALTFNYGQRNRKEIESAKKIAEWLGGKHKIIDVNLRQIGGSALTDEIEVPEEAHGIPLTYVPARNTIFLSFALAYAEVIDADSIFIGVNSVDYSGYPDCRPEYIEAFQKMANLALKRSVEGRPIKIKTPLLYFSKAEIVKKGYEMHVPFEKTWSCYRERERACGKCPSCKLRIEAFKEAGVRDPIEYE
ncbi:MAG TPA: 7-cyano-7-deazaguanine synthase QueC [Thermoplasmatales archaeon]|nr:7-cyano-7-deazaguanine synthase QueC [Thermoplasmatales archaeon]